MIVPRPASPAANIAACAIRCVRSASRGVPGTRTNARVTSGSLCIQSADTRTCSVPSPPAVITFSPPAEVDAS